jgi:hypothetical protein
LEQIGIYKPKIINIGGIMKKVALATFLITLVGLMALASPPFADTTIVTSFEPDTGNPTPGVWYENDVRTGGTASITDLTGVGGNLESEQPMPIGAAKLTTDFTNTAKAEVGVVDGYGKPNDIFSTLSISYYFHKATNAGQNLSAAPSLKLTFSNPVCGDPESDGDCYGTLVYEPYWDLGNTPPAADTWTRVTIDQDNGVFWWTGGFGVGGSPGGPPIGTLADCLAQFSSDFGDADLVLVSIGVGSYNQGQIGYFDKVQIFHSFGSGFNETYDFEPAPQFESLGECISTLIGNNCSGLSGRSRATCNHEQQISCFDLFDIK